MYEFVAHTFGWVGTAICILAFQCKSSRRLVFLQLVSGLVYTIHYFMLGAYTGCLSMIVAILSSFVICKAGRPWADWYWWRYIFVAAYGLSTLLTWQGMISAAAFIASATNTSVNFVRNGKVIRFSRLLVISPMWLVYNSLTHSWSGVTCEVFVIGSILISLWRYGLKALDQVS